MSDAANNIHLTWQLLSQFVSWEFCRHISQNNEDSSPETDVLSFLRNMIVQRTEKSLAEVTKHEIIAKFIMEINAVQNFQESCIIPLSESVKQICPELAPAVSKLIHHLETFSNVLDYTDESRKEIIKFRIQDSINDFSKDASRLLPQPDILELVESWNHRNHRHPRSIKKIIYNAHLLDKVLECLLSESITQSEAKLIAVALNEDKVFEKIMLNAEAEPEIADSEPFTFSQSSQPNPNILSQEFDRVQARQIEKIPSNRESSNLNSRNPGTVRISPVQARESEMPDVEFYENEEPPEVTSAVSPPSPSPPAYPFMHSNVTKQNGNLEIQNNKTCNNMQFAQSSANESDEDSSLHDRIHAKFKQIYDNQKNRNQSDSDTSDCDKNPEYRFLTPTYFKKGTNKNNAKKNRVIYISDTESNNSSIRTICPANSQQDDPNWSTRPSQIANKKSKKATTKKIVPPKKKIVGQIYSSSDSDEAPIDLSSSAPFRSPQPSTSAVPTRAEVTRPSKRRKVTKQLYRSPNISIDDFVSVIRKPTPGAASEVTVHQGINTRSAKKTPAKRTRTGNKCKDCSKTFKTQIALRRHIFLQHTNPRDDSDCDP